MSSSNSEATSEVLPLAAAASNNVHSGVVAHEQNISVFDDRLLRLLFENKDEFLADQQAMSSTYTHQPHHGRNRRGHRTFAIERSLFDTALQSIREEDENCSQSSHQSKKSHQSKNEQPSTQPSTQPSAQPPVQSQLVPAVYSH